MNIINFLLANWDSVLVVLAVIAVLIILYKRGKIDILKKVLFTFVTEAERQFGGGTGELKKATVIKWIYERLPKIVTLIITPKEVERLIESVLAYAKERWAANPAFLEYVKPEAAEIENANVSVSDTE